MYITLNIEFCEIYIRICALGFIQSGIFYSDSLILVPSSSGVLAEGERDQISRQTPVPLAGVWMRLAGCFQKGNVVGKIMATPKEVHILILQSCEHFTLHDPRDFVDVIMLRILRWGDYPGLSRWA